MKASPTLLVSVVPEVIVIVWVFLFAVNTLISSEAKLLSSSALTTLIVYAPALVIRYLSPLLILVPFTVIV